MSVTRISFQVDEVQSVLSLYDCIQVWRSPDADGSPVAFTEVTAAGNEPAMLVGTTEGPWDLDGLSLSISLDGATPFTVVFDDDDMILAEVMAEINAAKAGVASEYPVDTGQIRLTSPTAGTGSSVDISGSAATVLGLSTAKVNGKVSRLRMNANTEIYAFVDLDGASELYYKVRYFSSTTGAVSEFSTPRQGAPNVSVVGSLLVTATARLIDGAGRPVANRRIILVPTGMTQVTSGGNPFFSLPSVDRLEVKTDDAGLLSVELLIGQSFRAFIEGSTIQKDFVVPDADFDLLQVLADKPDVFTIVQAPPMPIRMS